MAYNLFQLLLIEELENLEGRNPRRFRQRENPFLELNDLEFIRTFRLSKEVVESLVEILRPYIQPQQRQTDLELERKVLICLRFLASGSYQLDIGSNYHFKVSQSSVSRCIHEVVDAMNQPEIFNRFVKWPQNIQELNEIRRGFFMKYDFPGIIGCIDCTHVAIFPPKINDLVYPEHLYVNRKNYHSINVQLICDHNLKILNVNALYPGSTHDSFVWSNSNVQRSLRTLHEAGNTEYFLIGDSGYPLRTWLLTPLDYEPQPNTPEARYNIRHKSIRSLIERCNGVLKMRFRCLLKHRVLHYTPTVASKIVNACVCLHNLCIQNNLPLPENENNLGDIDFGMYHDLHGHIVRQEPNRVNPELAAGRRLRNVIIRNL